MTLEVMEFPDTIWQEGSLQGDEENKKKIIQIGRTVPDLSKFQILMTLILTFKIIVGQI